MASPSAAPACAREPRDAGWLQQLNGPYHKVALRVFMVIVLGHWAEHLAQAIQIYALHWPVAKANGVLGLWYPWLVQTEALHYGYALIMLIGFWLLKDGFQGLSRKWWTAAFIIQIWHHFEHFLLLAQATLHHNFFGRPVPTSILQIFFPRVELHLFYNAVVFVPMVIGMYYHVHPPTGEEASACCTCCKKPFNQPAMQA